jgi:hypothetical protein
MKVDTPTMKAGSDKAAKNGKVALFSTKIPITHKFHAYMDFNRLARMAFLLRCLCKTEKINFTQATAG